MRYLLEDAGIAVFVAGLVYAGFKWLNGHASCSVKERIAFWLLGEGPSLKVVQDADGLLDRIFGENHFRPRCIAVSCCVSLVSALILAFVTFILVEDKRSTFDFTRQAGWSWFLFSVITVNLVADYFSLLQTRFFLAIARKSGQASWIGIMLIVDLLATAVMVCVFLASLVVLLTDLQAKSGASVEGLPIGYWETLWFLAMHQVDLLVFTWPWESVIYFTSFTTSVWLWLYGLAALSTRWIRGTTLLNRATAMFASEDSLERKPLELIGGVASSCVFLLLLATLFLAR